MGNKNRRVPKSPTVEVIPIPVNEIEQHPSMSFTGGILTVTIDYCAKKTQEEKDALMASLFNTLPSYAHWAKIIQIAIRPGVPHKDPAGVYLSHVKDMKFIIEQLNNFRMVDEVRMRIWIEYWNFPQLKLGAGLYGLKDKMSTFGYVVEGNEPVRVSPRSHMMTRLEGVYRKEFR